MRDECEIYRCREALGEEPIQVTFAIPGAERTIKVCDYHGDMIKVTDGFSIGPHNSFKPTPAVQKGNK